MRRTMLAACALLVPFSAQATFHIIHISEVYSNFDGTIQFIELQADAAGQTQLSEAELIAFGPTGTPQSTILDIATNFPALGSGETVLFATAAAQTELGFTADYTIPANSIPVADGRVVFQQDGGSLVVDAVGYGNFTGDNGGFGTPAAALPTNGTDSLTRTSLGTNNSLAYSIAANTPRRNDGTTGSLNPGSAVDDWTLY